MANECSKYLQALSNQHRYAVVQQLLLRPMSAGELTDHLQIEQSLLSHHLSILKDERIVTSSRYGKQIIYELAGWVKDEKPHLLNFGCCTIDFSHEREI